MLLPIVCLQTRARELTHAPFEIFLYIKGLFLYFHRVLKSQMLSFCLDLTLLAISVSIEETKVKSSNQEWIRSRWLSFSSC